MIEPCRRLKIDDYKNVPLKTILSTFMDHEPLYAVIMKDATKHLDENLSLTELTADIEKQYASTYQECKETVATLSKSSTLTKKMGDIINRMDKDLALLERQKELKEQAREQAKEFKEQTQVEDENPLFHSSLK